MKRKKATSATIYDVADRAKVSISTVSRVLNGKTHIKEKTRQRIQSAIADLNFISDPIGRGLVAKQFNLIEVCFSWSSVRINLENEWYTELLNGINEVVQEKRFGLMINTISGVFDLAEVQRRVIRDTVDGILMVSPYLKEEEMRRIKDLQVPMVVIGCRVRDPGVDYVDSDNQGAVAGVVAHLAGKGHRKIACITGEVEISGDAADRLKEFRGAMERHGLAVPEAYVVGGDFSKGSGERAMQKLLALKSRPTAVFACNDHMAIGAWDAAVSAGLKIGKDIALVGFDDITPASTPPYSLTTVKQDFRAISTRATQLLIEKIQTGKTWKPRQVQVPTQLVVRKSCGSKRK